jgi:hypothetical protein
MTDTKWCDCVDCCKGFLPECGQCQGLDPPAPLRRPTPVASAALLKTLREDGYYIDGMFSHDPMSMMAADEIERLERCLSDSTLLSEAARIDLKGYLLAHEVDIAMDINDYGDLGRTFEELFGRQPGVTK